jgi:hypothetical protein
MLKTYYNSVLKSKIMKIKSETKNKNTDIQKYWHRIFGFANISNVKYHNLY